MALGLALPLRGPRLSLSILRPYSIIFIRSIKNYNMGFQDTVILFNNFNEPLGIQNNTPALKAQVNFDLKNNQEFQFARIFVQVCFPGSLFGSSFRMEFNGKTLGSQQFAPIEGGCKALDVPVTDLIKGRNELTVHLDARLQAMEAIIFADLFYELNTIEGPTDVDVMDPKKENQTRDLIITAAVIGGGVGVTLLVLNRVLNARKRVIRKFI